MQKNKVKWIAGICGAFFSCSLLFMGFKCRSGSKTASLSSSPPLYTSLGSLAGKEFKRVEWPSAEQTFIDRCFLLGVFYESSYGKSQPLEDFLLELALNHQITRVLQAAEQLDLPLNARSKLEQLKVLGVESLWFKSSEVNAFAMGLNHMRVFSSLFEQTSSEVEFLCVLGHELGHLICRHTERQIDQGTKLLRNKIHLSFGIHSRDLEFEADAFGFRCCRALGYPLSEIVKSLEILVPKFRPSMLDSLNVEESEALTVLADFSHPLTFFRTAFLRDLAKSDSSDPTPIFQPPSPLDFWLLKERMALLTHRGIGHSDKGGVSPKKALESAADAKELKALQAADLYGQALREFQSGDVQSACQTLTSAPNLLRNHPWWHELKFALALKAQKPWTPQDEQASIQAFECHYGPWAALRWKAQLALARQQPEEAIQHLKSLPSSERYGGYWKACATAYQRANEPGHALWASAEYAAIRGDFKTASQLLKKSINRFKEENEFRLKLEERLKTFNAVLDFLQPFLT